LGGKVRLMLDQGVQNSSAPILAVDVLIFVDHIGLLLGVLWGKFGDHASKTLIGSID
jgi:hypothetical protein